MMALYRCFTHRTANSEKTSR